MTSALPDHLKRLFALLGVNCVLDVGAHEGGYVRLLRDEVEFEGKVISFEPASENYTILKSNFAGDTRWQGYQYALGRCEGNLELRVYKDTYLNSFLRPTEYGVSQRPDLAGAVCIETVDVRRLTDVFEPILAHIRAPKVFLKIDAQGFDLEIVEGSIHVLNCIVGIQLEASVNPIYHDMPSLSSVLGRLQVLGFGLTGMFPVSLDRDGLQVIEFDCVFYRIGAQRA
ncbi:MAG: FkbM family methyltransferase [Egibacteraceae bacterium]